MTDSDLIFIEGTPVTLDADGSDLIFDEGEPVAVGGDSSLVYDEGVPFGGDSSQVIATLPVAISELESLTDGGLWYIAGGQTDSGYDGQIKIIDPSDDSVSTGAAMAVPRASGTFGLIDGSGYYITGEGDGNDRNEAEAYDLAGDAWSTLSSAPVETDNPGWGVADGELYLFPVQEANNSYAYDPATDSYRQVTSPKQVSQPGQVSYNGSIYLFGGRDRSSSIEIPAVQRYDPGSDSWTRLTDMPGRRQAMAVGLDDTAGEVHVVGGTDDTGQQTATHWVYDVSADSWDTSPPNLNRARAGAGGAYLGGSMLVAGGVTDSGRSDEVLRL